MILYDLFYVTLHEKYFIFSILIYFEIIYRATFSGNKNSANMARYSRLGTSIIFKTLLTKKISKKGIY